MKHVGYYALALSCMITSCEDEIQDKEIPTIHITSPAADTKLWLEITAAAEVMDDQSVSRVAFYLNDDLLGEDTEAPYKLTFNSKKYEDGKYTLKTVAYDGANNQSSASREIEIFNTLLKVNVGEDYVHESSEIWLVVSGQDGEVIDYEMIENGKDIKFERPDGMDDDTFHAMFVNKYVYGSSNESVSVNEYHNLIPCKWILEGGNGNQQDSLGTAMLTFTHDIKDDLHLTYRNISNIDWSGSDFSNNVSNRKGVLTISAVPASMYIHMNYFDQNDLPRYVWINNIEVGSEYNLTKDDFRSMKSGQNIALPDNEWFSFYINGYSESGFKYQLYTTDGNEGETQISTYLPETGFNNYSHYLGLSSGVLRYNILLAGLPPSNYVLPKPNFEIINSNSEAFSAVTDHQADFSSAFWRYNEYVESSYINVYRYINADINEGKIQAEALEIPIEIMNKYPLLNHINELTYQYTTLYDYDGISSLNDHVDIRFKPNYEWPYYKNIIIYPDNVNAKLAREQLPEHLQEEKMRCGETW